MRGLCLPSRTLLGTGALRGVQSGLVPASPRLLAGVLGAVLLVLLPVSVPGQGTPNLLHLQARLADSVGVPLNGTVAVVARIYDQAVTGTALWSESHTPNAQNGVVDLNLGSVTPLPVGLFNGPGRWLSLQVGNDPEMLPRIRLEAVPYALRAHEVDIVNPAAIPPGSIGAAQLAPGSVGASQLAPASVGPAQIAPAAVGAPQLAAGAVGAPHIAAGAVVAGALGPGAVGSANIANGAVGPLALAANAVNTVHLVNASVTSAKLAPLSVQGLHIDFGAVGTLELADNGVTAPKIANNAVTSGKIADGAVASTKIANLAVTSAKIAFGAVDTPELAAGGVTVSKLADGAVTTTKILDGTIQAGDIGLLVTQGTPAVDIESPAVNVVGLRSRSLAATGFNSTGIVAQTASTQGDGVYGLATAATGVATGVTGVSHANNGRGVWGFASAGAGVIYGVFGQTNSPNGFGVYCDGRFTATGVKAFAQPHPSDPSKEIHFYCLEGNESGTYFRGSGATSGGSAVIPVPEDFRLVTEPEGLTVQLTAVGGPAMLWVASQDLDWIIVHADRDAAFHYVVNGVRRGFAGMPTIHANTSFAPALRGRPFGTQFPQRMREILVENGILNPDFTPNEATAAMMGWTLRNEDPREAAGAPDAAAPAGPGTLRRNVADPPESGAAAPKIQGQEATDRSGQEGK